MIGIYVRTTEGKPYKIVDVVPSVQRVLAVPVHETGEPIGGQGTHGIEAERCHTIVFDLQALTRGERRLLP